MGRPGVLGPGCWAGSSRNSVSVCRSVISAVEAPIFFTRTAEYLGYTLIPFTGECQQYTIIDVRESGGTGALAGMVLMDSRQRVVSLSMTVDQLGLVREAVDEYIYELTHYMSPPSSRGKGAREDVHPVVERLRELNLLLEDASG